MSKVLNIKALAPFKGYVVDSVRFEDSASQINLKFDRRSGPRCPSCSARLPKNKTGTRTVMDCPMAHSPITFLSFPTVQAYCPSCQHYVTTCPEEIHPQAKASWRFMRLVSAWASVASCAEVAAMFEISDSTVRRYDKAVLEVDTPPPLLDGLEVLLIDEKSVRKRHGYVTFILNGRTGELLHTAEGKKRESVESFLVQLTEEQKASIQAVGIDRAGAYQAAVEEHLPHTDIVYDRFHLMMNLNQALDEVRRSQWRQANKEERSVLKGQRFLLLANQDRLDIDGQVQLHRLLQANEGLTMAHLLKEQFRGLFFYKREGWALKALKNWCQMAKASGLQPFQRLARSFSRQAKRVCGFIKHRLTSGRIEGFNNLVSRIIHKACGVRDLEYLDLRLRHHSVMRC